jgi:hypothetical protein
MIETQDLVTYSNCDDILKEIDSAFWDIPFENSQFQTEKFIIGGSITPERAYRNIGLNLQTKLSSLREFQYNQAKEDIDIEELQDIINNPDSSSYAKRKAQLDIDFKLSKRPFSAKLMNDAITEINILYSHFKALPKYTREQFEDGERLHFETKLTRQIENPTGAVESLINMQHDITALENYQARYKQLLIDGKNIN